MNSKPIHTILSLALLMAMLPALLGLSFIHHYCSECKTEKKETVLFLLSHRHDHAECFCTEVNDSKCKNNAGTCTCKKEQDKHSHHKDSCDIHFKILKIASTFQKYEEQIVPVDVQLPVYLAAGFTPQTLYAGAVENSERQTPSSPLPLTDIHILHCVFRL